MLEQKMKDYIERVGLVEKYRNLSEKYRTPSKQEMERVDIEVIKNMIQALGYKVKYFKGEQFFKVIVKQNKEIEMGYNISVKYGVVELIMWIREKGEYIGGGPVGFLISQYTGEETLIKYPKFSSYEELKDILTYMFDLLKQYEEEE